MSAAKFSTLKEDSDKSWERFEAALKKKPMKIDIKKYGKRDAVKMEDLHDINVLCPTTGCNIFHADDMCVFLINIGCLFELVYWHTEGRDRLCQFKITGYSCYFEVFATGYGTGETIHFSKGFPEDVKFKLCREMCIHETKSLYDYYNSNNKSYKNEMYEALREVYYNNARSMSDLYKITEIYHYLEEKEFYDKSPEWKVPKIKVFGKMASTGYDEYLKTQKQILKSRFYKEYLKEKEKVRGRKNENKKHS